MIDLPKLMDELSKLTVLEAAELAKLLKGKWQPSKGRKMINDEGVQDQSAAAYFGEQLAAFKKETELSSRISRSIGGQMTSERIGWSQWIHLRLCIAADSLIRVANFHERIQNGEVCTLDQSTIASIVRGMIEATAMIAYMTEPSMTDSDWKFKRLVICLHDATTRYKMFKGWKNLTESDGHRNNMDQLKAEIQSTVEFNGLPKDIQDKVLSGQVIYLRGLRSAIRLMDWDVDDFSSVYAYLSSHAHSSPVSFIRLGKHGVDFLKPTGAQYATAGFAIEQGCNVLKFATDRMLALFPDATKNITEVKTPTPPPDRIERI